MRGSTRRLAAGVVGVVVALAVTGGAGAAAPPDDRLLPPAMHQTEKARTLATKHARALRDLNAEVYHCLPWLEVLQNSIGFYRPRHFTGGDTRYLSIRIYIEQEPSPQFAKLTTEQRAEAMFSRYAGPMLRRMTRSAGLRNDEGIDGFTVILEWLKQAPTAANQRPVHETIAVFVDRATALDYLSGRLAIRELAARARVLGFDGETSLGALRLAAWDDDFVSTFRPKNYEPDAGVTCQAQ